MFTLISKVHAFYYEDRRLESTVLLKSRLVFAAVAVNLRAVILKRFRRGFERGLKRFRGVFERGAKGVPRRVSRGS